MNMKYAILIIFVFSTSAWGQDLLDGDMKIEVNADGTFSYYIESDMLNSNAGQVAAIDYSEVEALLTSSGIEVSTFELTDEKNTPLGYFVTQDGDVANMPLAMAMDTGLTARAVDAQALPSNFVTGYALSSSGTDTNAVWLPTATDDQAISIEYVVPINWSATKITQASLNNMKARVPVPKEDFTAAIRESLLIQAKGIACGASILPKDVGASVSLSASAGFIVGGEGTVSFSATWDTSELCP